MSQKWRRESRAHSRRRAPVESVSRMAGDKCKSDDWKKLHQPDQAEMQGVARHLVNLLCHDNGLHLPRNERKKTPACKQPEIPMPKGYPGMDAMWMCVRHGRRGCYDTRSFSHGN